MKRGREGTGSLNPNPLEVPSVTQGWAATIGRVGGELQERYLLTILAIALRSEAAIRGQRTGCWYLEPGSFLFMLDPASYV